MQDRQIVQTFFEAIRQTDDDRENHRRRTYNSGADEDRLRSGFEGVTRTIVFFQHEFGVIPLRGETVGALNFLVNSVDRFNAGKLVDGLRVVGHRAVRVDCDRHWPHSQETERHQAKGEDSRCQHVVAQCDLGNQERATHQANNCDAQPVGREVAGDHA